MDKAERASYMRQWRASQKRRREVQRIAYYECVAALKTELKRHGVLFDDNWYLDPDKTYREHVVGEILLRALETLEKYRLRNS